MDELLTKRYFKFNLLPKRSKQEISLIKERDNSVFYSAVIVLFGSFLWLVSVLFLNLVMNPRLQVTINSVENLKLQINGFSNIRAKNGELVYKAQLLKPLLDRKIDTGLIFSIGDGMVENIPNAQVVNYGRETSGKFVFRLAGKTFSDITRVYNNMTSTDLQKQISNLEVRDLNFDTSLELIIATIAFDINGIATS